MNLKAFHCIVTGNVQGVFYRANTQKRARELGVTGWVRNLDDGNVEVMMFGAEERLMVLHSWLWKGPATAQVTDVTCVEAQWQSFDDFVVR